MCGLYGELSFGAEPPDPAIARAMGRQLVHRGPDDDGLYHDDRVAMGLRRLSIIDLAGGHRPLFNEDASIALVRNGAIYNVRELRAELIEQGHQFRTGSDAEVLIHLYEQHGNRFVERAEGMFGFALWDRPRRRLLLGRDRLGIKPVYLAALADRLLFASEAKALLAHPQVAAALDPVALQNFLALGYVNGGDSLFRGIRLLAPGHLLVCEDGQSTERQYWALELSPEPDRPAAEWVEAIRAELASSVAAQMVSDVPIAAFLSGGIDSSTIVTLMSRASDAPVKTYSIGYSGSSGADLYNELPYARAIAEACQTEHHEIVVEPNVVGLLPRLVWHMDAPISDSALITSSLVSEFASRDVKVILSGVGGDELFGGYDRYLMSHYVRLVEALPRWLRRSLLAPVARRLPVDRHNRLLNLLRYLRTVVLLAESPRSERYHQLMEIFTRDELAGLLRGGLATETDALARLLARCKGGSDLDRMFLADMQTQLRDDLLLLTDKMSMAHSLECRVPLLDERLVNLAARMPDGMRVRGKATRFAIKQALRGILPDATIDRKKRGFGAPVGAWLKHELQPIVDFLLAPAVIEQRGLFRPAAVDRVVRDHRASRGDYTDHLFALVTLEIWQRIFLDGRSVETVAAELDAAVAGGTR
jgi:asparagine synthase (glutamine-hydrolysing)